MVDNSYAWFLHELDKNQTKYRHDQEISQLQNQSNQLNNEKQQLLNQQHNYVIAIHEYEEQLIKLGELNKHNYDVAMELKEQVNYYANLSAQASQKIDKLEKLVKLVDKEKNDLVEKMDNMIVKDENGNEVLNKEKLIEQFKEAFKDKEDAENLLSKPMREIAEKNKDFAQSYYTQQMIIGSFLLRQSSYLDLLIEEYKKQNLSNQEIKDKIIKERDNKLSNKT